MIELINGLQIKDANGNVILSPLDRITRRIGTITTSSNSSGSRSVPGEDPIWFAVQGDFSMGFILNNNQAPIVSVNQASRVISWTAARQVVLIEYGLY